jgi:cbb3-type cytochrome oxidase subunit 3
MTNADWQAIATFGVVMFMLILIAACWIAGDRRD